MFEYYIKVVVGNLWDSLGEDDGEVVGCLIVIVEKRGGGGGEKPRLSLV